MRITHFDRKSGEMKISIETLEDLWHIERVLRPKDRVEARTLRSVKFGEGKEEKKPVTILLEVDSAEFAEAANRLRVGGKIISGTPEDFIQIGRHHTFEFEPSDKLKIIKGWKAYEVDRLEKAVEQSRKPLLRIVIMDESDATTAILKGYGISYGPEIRCMGSKREGNYEEKVRMYFGEIASYISKYPEKFIVAGPGFAKDGLKEFLKEKYPELLSRISFENCSTSEKSGVTELLKRGVVAKVAGEAQLEKEEKILEEFMLHLNKDDGLAAYGKEQVRSAVECKAVSILMVLDENLRKDPAVEEIAELGEKNRAELMFFSSESDGGQKLKGFGGIAAILRFRLD